MTLLLPLLIKIWKPFVGGLSIILLLYGVFLYGKSTERQKWERKVLTETIKREREERKVIDHGKEVIDKFKESKSTPLTPIKIRFYECLLGDEPLQC